MLAKSLYVAPSFPTNPVAVTSSFVNGFPSYIFVADADFKVTSFGLIFRVPSTITNFTLLKFALLFSKFSGFSSML